MSLFRLLDWKSAWSETCVFFLFRGRWCTYVAVFSTWSKDVMLMSVPYVCSTWQIIAYFMHSMTQWILLWLSGQLPIEFNCRQLFKVPADRRNNGRLRKYHYASKPSYRCTVPLKGQHCGSPWHLLAPISYDCYTSTFHWYHLMMIRLDQHVHRVVFGMTK